MILPRFNNYYIIPHKRKIAHSHAETKKGLLTKNANRDWRVG